jgi:tetratricopeptide (TPR) repeat protein
VLARITAPVYRKVEKRISVVKLPPPGRTAVKRWRFPGLPATFQLMPGPLFRACLVGLIATACVQPTTRRSIALPISAQALSLLGDTLWSLPIPPADGPELVEQLTKARGRVASSPLDVNAALVVARRTADLGRLRESIDLYNKADQLNPVDPRIPRYRGEILMQLREFELAQRDFQSSATRMVGKPTQVEFLEVEEVGLLGSTLQFNVYRLLGYTYYLMGDFTKARLALIEAAKAAPNGDDVIAAGLWLFFSSRRLGAVEESRMILTRLTDSAAVGARDAELSLLRAFRHGVTSDSLHLDLRKPFEVERDALTAYGLGFALMQLGRTDEAELVFEHIRTYRDWTAMPVIAAEAELARLRKK